jgi:hypothetical protein
MNKKNMVNDGNMPRDLGIKDISWVLQFVLNREVDSFNEKLKNIENLSREEVISMFKDFKETLSVVTSLGHQAEEWVESQLTVIKEIVSD